MKKTILLISSVIALIALSSCFFFPQESDLKRQETTDITQNDSNNSSLWKTYEDYELGFKIFYPVRVSSFSSCTEETIPIQFFKKGNVVYVEKEYYYAEDCEKKENTFDLLEKENSKIWRMYFKAVNNDEELDQFIKELYGDKCNLGEKIPTSQDDVFDVHIAYDGKSIMESGCFLNFMTVMKYNVQSRRAVSWDIGQDGNFWNEDIDNGNFLDNKMAESFRFL